ncbi:hypothetical protein LLG90_08340 [Aromatoleum toluclasticum]|uniref:hypothetical protein n=1 Tax=Aromatoleum toluclasticum TaxID=92003 RepID=UPI001D18748D|nr:hypothetical protein [Aromatoleum toluclasticum]MCC4115353.1 hypothetical protein [Aromatoleum toluclasticum]
MLMAIAENKAGRISIPGTDGSVSWREVFRRSEDLLTAVFFGRLQYLSDAGINRVLGVLIGQEAADSLGTLRTVECWPHLTGLEDRRWVEPDVLLHFECGLVLIEVKPPFGGDQYLKQWQAEVHSLVAECRSGERSPPEIVHFLALGRNTLPVGAHALDDFRTEGCFELSVHTREWEAILAAIPTWTSECSRGDAAVFKDWIRAFELFGLHYEVPRYWTELLTKEGSTVSLAPLSWWQVGNSAGATQAACSRPTEKPWIPLLQFVRDNSLELNTWK